MELKDAFLFEKSLDGIGRLSAVGDPLLCLLCVYLNHNGGNDGILGANLLDESAVTGIS